MRIDVGKCIIVYSCLIAVSCSCFHKHILQALTAKVNELFGKQSCEGDAAPPAWELDSDGPVASQRGENDEKMQLSDVDWRSICSKIANNWWIIAVSSLLPFVVFWRAQYNIKNRVCKTSYPPPPPNG